MPRARSARSSNHLFSLPACGNEKRKKNHAAMFEKRWETRSEKEVITKKARLRAGAHSADVWLRGATSTYEPTPDAIYSSATPPVVRAGRALMMKRKKTPHCEARFLYVRDCRAIDDLGTRKT